jgi:periplasmic protein TonB
VPQSNYSLSFILALLFHFVALIVLGVTADFTKNIEDSVTTPPDVMTLSLIEEPLTETPIPKSADTAPRPEHDTKLDFLRVPKPLLDVPTLSDLSSEILEIPKQPLPDFKTPPPTVFIPSPTTLPDTLVMPQLTTVLTPQESTDPYSTHSDSTGGTLQGSLTPPTTKDQTIRPKYPMTARRRGEEGRVILDVLVSKDGQAQTITVVASSGYKELDQAAEDALRATRFNPGERNGKPVEASARLVILFQLKAN